MCDYVTLETGKCNISGDNCPFVYFCNKTRSYKELSSMPTNCKIKQTAEIPKGYYKVCFERRNNLYVNIDNNIEIIKNPFNFVPLYVQVTKLKNGDWKIKMSDGVKTNGR